MARKSGHRMAILLVLAAATGCLSYYSTREPAEAMPLHRRTQAQSAPVPVQVPLATSEVDAATPVEGEEEVDPFAPHSWQAPPPVQEAPKALVEVAAPPAPVVPVGPPPLPYKFMGRMNDESDANKQMVYLSKGEQVTVVQGGETLDDTYKVLNVETDHIEFEHIPTGEKQILSIAANDK